MRQTDQCEREELQSAMAESLARCDTAPPTGHCFYRFLLPEISLMDVWSQPSLRLPQCDRQRGEYLDVPHHSVEGVSRGTKAPRQQLLFLPRCLIGSPWILLEFAAQTHKTTLCLRVTIRSCGNSAPPVSGTVREF